MDKAERLWNELCEKQGFDDLPYLFVATKHAEKIKLREVMRQTVKESKEQREGNIPVVAHKKEGREWLVTLRAKEFFEIYSGYLYMMQSVGDKV